MTKISRVALPRLRVRPVTPHDWPLLERLFGDNGACGGCWCMVWRVPPGQAYWRAHKGEANRRSFKRLITTGAAHGCLAFAGDEPVGWVSIGPKADFNFLVRSRTLGSDLTPSTWSVTCFFVPSKWRDKGIASALLRGAVKLARARGGAVLEGYPVAIRKPGKMPPVFAWTGVPQLFAQAGFSPVGAKARGRSMVRRVLRKQKEPRRREGGVLTSRADEVGRRG